MSLNGPAAARLYDQHVDAVYAYAARRIGDEAAVSIVEDVFEHALGQQARRPAQTSSDLGWLLAIATAFLRRHSETERTRLLNWANARATGSGSIPRVTDPLLSSDAEDVAATSTARVMAAVAELEPEDRDLLFLVAWEGASSSLASEATGIAQGAVRSRLGAIRKELRRRIGDTGPNDDTSDGLERPTDSTPGDATGDATNLTNSSHDVPPTIGSNAAGNDTAGNDTAGNDTAGNDTARNDAAGDLS